MFTHGIREFKEDYIFIREAAFQSTKLTPQNRIAML